MTLYAYKAVGEKGAKLKGSINAASEREARAQLKSQGMFPLEVKASRPFTLELSGVLSLQRKPRINMRQLGVFCRQFATLLAATIPYDAALEMILKQTESTTLKDALGDIRGRVVEGTYLADALGAHPHLFPPMMLSMIRSGESSGTVVQILERLADYYEQMAKLRSRISSALVYPVFMMLFGTGIVVFMVTYIIPKITRLLENFHATLPLPTRILIAASNLLTGWWWLLLLLIGASAYWLRRYLNTEPGRWAWDRLELRLPLWGLLRKKMLLQRFSQTLAALLKSGVELKAALEIGSEVLENKLYRQAMETVIVGVQNKGLPLAVALRRSGMFPDDMIQMIAIGESTAQLDAMLDNHASRLSQEISATLDSTMSMFEPIMILVMGVVVAFIVISVMLPMLQLNQMVR